MNSIRSFGLLAAIAVVGLSCISAVAQNDKMGTMSPHPHTMMHKKVMHKKMMHKKLMHKRMMHKKMSGHTMMKHAPMRKHTPMTHAMGHDKMHSDGKMDGKM